MAYEDLEPEEFKAAYENTPDAVLIDVRTPAEIAATIIRLQDELGGFEHASLQVNFNTMEYEPALASMRLFAREVMPRFAGS